MLYKQPQPCKVHLQGLVAVTQPLINGKVICGKLGGLSSTFAQSVRPNAVNQTCPIGTQPCSTNTSPENTICMTLDYINNDKCPINSITFIYTKNFNSVDPSSILLQGFNNGQGLLYSKNGTTLPITATMVSTSVCANN